MTGVRGISYPSIAPPTAPNPYHNEWSVRKLGRRGSWTIYRGFLPLAEAWMPAAAKGKEIPPIVRLPGYMVRSAGRAARLAIRLCGGRERVCGPDEKVCGQASDLSRREPKLLLNQFICLSDHSFRNSKRQGIRGLEINCRSRKFRSS